MVDTFKNEGYPLNRRYADMKILVILTGGTIGSRCKNGIIDVDGSPYRLIDMYEKEYGKTAEFCAVQPINILSENMGPRHWEAIFAELSKVLEYDGAIIAHGTDTLAYTSAAAGLLFGNCGKPIVLTGANKPLDDPKSDGLANFKDAVDIIMSKKLKGVFTVFDGDIYIATRILESDAFADKYRSFDGASFGKIENGKISCSVQLKEGGFALEKLPEFKNKVVLIRPYPGMEYDDIDVSGAAAVVHYLYHSGTASEKASAFVEKCVKKGIPVYAASFKPDAKLYASSDKLLCAGAVPLFNISPEAAYVKAVIAHNQNECAPGEYMAKNIYFESI